MRVITTLFALGFLATCGSNTGSVNQPLTVEQKKQFSETVRAMGVAERASKGAKQSSLRRDPEFSEEMMARLRECEFHTTPSSAVSWPIEPGTTVKSDFDTTFSAEGVRCPIALTFGMKGSSEMGDKLLKVDGSFSYEYKVVDMQGFAKFVDIVQMNARGSFGFHANESSLDGSANYSGEAVSTKQGKLRFYVRGQANGVPHAASGESVVGVEYSDHTAELKDKVTIENGLEVHVYTLNAEVITKNEYYGYLDKLGSLAGSARNEAHGQGSSQISEPHHP